MTIGERILDVLRIKGLRQADMARDIKISNASVSQICSGRTNPSAQSIAMFCKAYNVNEDWLCNGVGDMFVQRSVDDEIAAFCGEVMHMADDAPQRRILSLLARIPQEYWKTIDEIIDAVADQK